MGRTATVTVECFTCDTIFETVSSYVVVELEDFCYEDYDGYYDCSFEHIYRVYCPTCGEMTRVDLVDDNGLGCCLSA